MRLFVKALVMLFGLSLGSVLAEPASGRYLPEQQWLPQLDALQRKAQAEQKLLLLVLGADWCHDSVALLQRFNEAAFSAVLAQRYELAFIDVGYLQFGQTTAQRYQLPLYYGTPTVMIIAPDTGQLLNKTDLMLWTNAASRTEAEYQEYFITTDFQQRFASEQQQLAGIDPTLFKQITEFEQQQADKLRQAYQYLGPLLKAYKTSGKPASTEFKQSWEQVKHQRSRLLADVQQLKQQAKTLKADQSLLLPQYPAFSFVKE